MGTEELRGVVCGTGHAVRSATQTYRRLQSLRDDAEAALSDLEDQLADAAAALRDAQRLHTQAVIEQTRTVLKRSEQTLRDTTRARLRLVVSPGSDARDATSQDDPRDETRAEREQARN